MKLSSMRLSRLLISSTLILMSLGDARNVDARKPSEKLSVTLSALSILDTDSTASWQKQRGTLVQEWMEILGTPPPEAPLDPRILGTTHEPDHDRILVSYQTEPGIRTDAYLLIPHQLKEKAPAAVVFHATTSDHILQPVGLASASTRHLALHLVRRGYVTLSPRCFIYGYANESATTVPGTLPRNISDYTSESKALLARVPGWTGMGKMLWDGHKAVDYLLTRPEADPDRIVCVGHSLGAKEALYLAAFDPRVRAGIASEGGVGLRHSNWDAIWYLGAGVRKWGAERDHHQLLALTAPRSFLIAGGGDSDGEHTRPLVDAARPVYRLLGRPDSLVLSVHDHGHDFPDEIREKAFDWLDRQSRD